MATRRRNRGTAHVNDLNQADEEEPRAKELVLGGELDARRKVPETEVPAHLLRRAAAIFLVGLLATFVILLA